MGMYKETYIGAFMEVGPLDDIVTSKKLVSCCTNDLCSKWHSETKNKFCPDCGTKIEPTEIEFKEGVELYDLLEDFCLDEELWSPGIVESDKEILFPHNHGYVASLADDEFFNIETMDVKGLRDAFRNQSGMELLIDYFEKHGIYYKITVGVVNYYN